MTETGLLETAKEMVVKKRNKLVNRLKLQALVQGPDQPVQMFVADLKSVARTCNFTTKCGDCRHDVDYTEDIVLNQGLSDDDIQRKVLAKPEEDCSLDKVEKFVLGEESGNFSLADTKAASAVAAVSGYRQQQRSSHDQAGDGPPKQFPKSPGPGVFH